MKHTKKIKQKLQPQGPDLTLEQAIAHIKEEVLEEVRGLSSGRIISVYRLTEIGEELIRLEADLQKRLDSESPLVSEAEVHKHDDSPTVDSF